MSVGGEGSELIVKMRRKAERAREGEQNKHKSVLCTVLYFFL